MSSDDSASDDTDDRRAATGEDREGSGRAVPGRISRRGVLRGAAAAALGGSVLGATAGRGAADHAPPVEWASTELDAEGASDGFGAALALDAAGDTLVVGDPLRLSGDVSTGGVSVYERGDGGWAREALLLPGYRARLDRVGAAVAVDAAGETVVVGVPGEDALGGQCGAVSVYDRTGGAWTHRTKLLADDAATRDRLGRAVAVDDAGERVVAGAPGDGAAGEGGPGAAYVFDLRRDGGDAEWTQTAKLTTTDRRSGALAGAALSLAGDGETVLVGAPGADDGAGAVVPFTADPWSPIGRVENPAETAVAFGSAVATNGRGGLATAPELAERASDGTATADEPTGFATRLDGGAWAAARGLPPTDAPAAVRFGTDAAIAADGDSAVVAGVLDAPDSTARSSDAGDETGEAPATGGVHVYDGRDGWRQSHRLTPSDSGAVTAFGRSVALDADGRVVAVAGRRAGGRDADTATTSGTGDPGADGSADPAGTVTVFVRESPTLSIDIEPDEEWPATVPYAGGGEIAVAVEHTDDFDPATVDVDTVRFGPPRVVDDGGGARAVDGGTRRDTDSDGGGDLVMRFPVVDAGFAADDFAARLVGETVHGTPIADHDFVVVVESDESDGANGAGGNATASETDTDGSP